MAYSPSLPLAVRRLRSVLTCRMAFIQKLVALPFPQRLAGAVRADSDAAERPFSDEFVTVPDLLELVHSRDFQRIVHFLFLL